MMSEYQPLAHPSEDPSQCSSNYTWMGVIAGTAMVATGMIAILAMTQRQSIPSELLTSSASSTSMARPIAVAQPFHLKDGREQSPVFHASRDGHEMATTIHDPDAEPLSTTGRSPANGLLLTFGSAIFGLMVLTLARLTSQLNHGTGRGVMAMAANVGEAGKRDDEEEEDKDDGPRGGQRNIQRPFPRGWVSPLSRLRGRVNNLFGDRLALIDTYRTDPFDVADQLLADVQSEFRDFGVRGGSTLWHPSVDVKEESDAITFHCDVPGVKKEDFQVDLHDGRLVIGGKREKSTEDKAEGWHYSERSFGSFSRSFEVPPATQPSDISTSYRDGVLEVRVKKQPPEQQPQGPARINIE